jgi:hypothetical protein
VLTVARGTGARARGRADCDVWHRAALHRHAIPSGGNRALEPGTAIDDKELGTPQAARDEVIEYVAPGRGTLAAHLLDRQQHFLAVRAHADDDEQRDRSGFAIEPHTHHRAVENQPHDRLIGQRAGIPRVPVALNLAPYPAHGVLAHRAAEQGAKCTAHAARIGAGQIGARDQRVCRQRAALISSQRPALGLTEACARCSFPASLRPSFG